MCSINDCFRGSVECLMQQGKNRESYKCSSFIGFLSLDLDPPSNLHHAIRHRDMCHFELLASYVICIISLVPQAGQLAPWGQRLFFLNQKKKKSTELKSWKRHYLS